MYVGFSDVDVMVVVYNVGIGILLDQGYFFVGKMSDKFFFVKFQKYQEYCIGSVFFIVNRK